MTCKLQTDNPRGNSPVEMALHGVVDLPMQALKVVGLGKDGLPQRTRRIAAFRSLVYKKNKLIHKFMIAVFCNSFPSDTPVSAPR